MQKVVLNAVKCDSQMIWRGLVISSCTVRACTFYAGLAWWEIKNYIRTYKYVDVRTECTYSLKLRLNQDLLRSFFRTFLCLLVSPKAAHLIIRIQYNLLAMPLYKKWKVRKKHLSYVLLKGVPETGQYRNQIIDNRHYNGVVIGRYWQLTYCSLLEESDIMGFNSQGFGK